MTNRKNNKVSKKQTNLKVLVGLGNPGITYLHHRHNAGYWFLDEIINRFGLTKKERPGYFIYPWNHDFGKTYIVRSKAFMNESGIAVSQVVNFYKVDQSSLCVVYDDMDYLPGVARMKKSGGSGGHNGIKSIHAHLGKEFYRLRLGVGRPKDAGAVKRYVLTRPDAEEMHAIKQSIAVAVDHIELLLEGRYDSFIEKIHTLT